MSAGTCAFLGTIALGVITATAVWAVDDVSLHIDAVTGDGWVAHDVNVNLGLPRESALVRATVGRLQVQALGQTLTNIQIDCPQLDLQTEYIACTKARVLADWPALGKQSLTAKLIYGRRDGSLDLALDGVRLGEGRAAIRGKLSEGAWTANVRLQKAPVERLLQLAREMKLSLPAMTATGHVDLDLTARGRETNLSAAKFDATLHEVTANNESGSIASDKLSLRAQAMVSGSAKQWQFDVALNSSAGQAFVQPIFLDLSAHGVTVTASGKLSDGNIVTLDRYALDHADVMKASGSALMQLDHAQPVRDLQLKLDALTFPGAYESYLQPLLLDTSFQALQTVGSIGGALVVRAGEPQSIELTFKDISVDDGKGTLNLTSLRGQWHWLGDDSGGDDDSDDRSAAGARPPNEVAASRLQWNGGSMLGLELGPTELQFTTRGRQFRLVQPARMPLLDGAIDLETFRVRNAGLPSVAFLVDATLRPISVQRLCRAFGWPEFGGRISGAISKLRMREGIITLGTTLHAQVFNGEVTISDLRLEEPFGKWPRFYSNIAFDRLELEPMTSAFSFGRITGQLSGAITGLQLFNWTPVAFDAKLYTPADDRSRHRISQRAVQNIGSIGGGGAGVTAALSGGAMRFFEDFNYDRLGMSCRLANDVCVMDGVAPAANGNYYLVKGKGLPRIDVIGSSRRVDWPRLVQQLMAVTESDGPVVR